VYCGEADKRAPNATKNNALTLTTPEQRQAACWRAKPGTSCQKPVNQVDQLDFREMGK
jgi:hypothetical protein